MDMENKLCDDQGGGGGLDEIVRVEVRKGCQLVGEIEKKMKLMMAGGSRGCLSMESYNGHEVLRASLMGACAAIITSFSNVITFLNSPSGEVQIIKGGNDDQGVAMEGDQPREDQTDHHRQSSVVQKLLNSAPACTSPPSPEVITMVEPLVHPSTPMCSTATPPQSPKNRSPSMNRSTLSPPSLQPETMDLSPADDKLSQSDCITHLSVALDPNGSIARKRKTEIMDTESEKQNCLSKRRKFMPKWKVKICGSQSHEQANEAAPEDGFTWRKYGQKEILGSRHPRSYYRCSHKRDLGCPAIKHVQRSDDHNTSTFHVTYKGDHTCHANLFSTESRAYPSPIFIPAAGSSHDFQSSLHLNSSCLTLSSTGSLQVGHCAIQNELSKSLSFKPMAGATFQPPDPTNFKCASNFSNFYLPPKKSTPPMYPEAASADTTFFLIDHGFDSPKATIAQPEDAAHTTQHDHGTFPHTSELAAAILEDPPANAEPEIMEVVGEHVPTSEFEVDFILDGPGSCQQNMLDLHSLLFEP